LSTPGTVTSILFALLVGAVAALFVGAALRSAAPARPGPREGLVIVASFLVWLIIPGALAKAGLLDRWTLPAPALVLVGVATVFTTALAFSPFGTRLLAAVPLFALVGFQFFRVPVELLLHRLYADGVIPVQMTYSGRNFDIVSGLTAAAVGMVLAVGGGSRRLVLGWNFLGLALLGNIVIIALLSTPVPFRTFLNEPANRLPGVFPYVWLPTMLVQAALFGHLLVFRALARGALRAAAKASAADSSTDSATGSAAGAAPR
jgi:hypothetical protein